MLRPKEQPPKDAERPGRGASRPAFVARLQVILRHWPSADRLARAVGVSPSAFRKWLRGEAEPSRERLVALADATSVSIAWLAKGEGPEPQFHDVPRAERSAALGSPSEVGLDARGYVLLPKRSEAAAAGAATPAPPTLRSEFIAFSHDWIRDTFSLGPEDLLLEAAVGESMQPTIRDNDLLLIDMTDRKLREFGIYVLEFRGERLVKRVQRKLDGSLLLISDNAIYEPERIPPERAHEVTVIGRVVWGGGKI
jgi:phage repressor protein C with HTH and peptisase S24 domain